MFVGRQVRTTPTKRKNEISERLCEKQHELKNVDQKYLDLGAFPYPSLYRITGMIYL